MIDFTRSAPEACSPLHICPFQETYKIIVEIFAIMRSWKFPRILANVPDLTALELANQMIAVDRRGCLRTLCVIFQVQKLLEWSYKCGHCLCSLRYTGANLSHEAIFIAPSSRCSYGFADG
jgi:hypothetical protein